MFAISTMDIIIIALGAISFVIWLVLFIRGSQYNALFDVLEEEEFQFKEIYGLGYGVLEMMKYSYKSKSDRKLRSQLDILYGEKYSDYYLRVTRAQQVTMGLTVWVLACSFYGLTGEIAAFGVGVMFTGLALYYYGTLADKKIEERSEALLRDFSDVVAKLALLTNAGMIMREAWVEVAAEGEGTIYEEMRLTVDEMNNGVADVDAIYNFGVRCIIPEIKKFTSTIVQGMVKGNSELTLMLQEQSKEVWQLKKQLVRREAEKAASKLMLPMCIMFVGILIMIIVPIFANMGAV